MKFLIVLLFFVIPVVLFAALLIYFDKATNTSKPKNIRNYKVRFDAAREKYYIVNQLDTHDVPVTNWFGFRVMYKDKLKAEFVLEKLNS